MSGKAGKKRKREKTEKRIEERSITSVLFQDSQ
jgi:hypothetical protein